MSIAIKTESGKTLGFTPGKLEPCPCCGNEEPELIKCPSGYYVICNVYACGRAYYVYYRKMQDAIDKWNNREV